MCMGPPRQGSKAHCVPYVFSCVRELVGLASRQGKLGLTIELGRVCQQRAVGLQDAPMLG